LPPFEDLIRADGGKEKHQTGDGPRPAHLVAGADAGSIIAVEILVEQDLIPPVAVVLELLGPGIDGPSVILFAQEDVGQPAVIPGPVSVTHPGSPILTVTG
jgi:hypothetical protein